VDKKLTLRLDENVIESAKIYACNHKISLSKIFKSYLDSVTNPKEDKNEISITPLVESLSGVINLPIEIDYRKQYRDFLVEKYK